MTVNAKAAPPKPLTNGTETMTTGTRPATKIDLAQMLGRIQGQIEAKFDHMTDARLSRQRTASTNKSREQVAFERGLTLDESEAIEEVMVAIGEYVANARSLRLPLSSYVLTTLIDEGKIAGIEFGCDTLEAYSPALARGLQKLDERFPILNPLAPVNEVAFG